MLFLDEKDVPMSSVEYMLEEAMEYCLPPQLSANIISINRRKASNLMGKATIDYVIKVQYGSRSWLVKRSYSEFRRLRDMLVQRASDSSSFPGRKRGSSIASNASSPLSRAPSSSASALGDSLDKRNAGSCETCNYTRYLDILNFPKKEMWGRSNSGEVVRHRRALLDMFLQGTIIGTSSCVAVAGGSSPLNSSFLSSSPPSPTSSRQSCVVLASLFGFLNVQLSCSSSAGGYLDNNNNNNIRCDADGNPAASECSSASDTSTITATSTSTAGNTDGRSSYYHGDVSSRSYIGQPENTQRKKSGGFLRKLSPLTVPPQFQPSAPQGRAPSATHSSSISGNSQRGSLYAPSTRISSAMIFPVVLESPQPMNMKEGATFCIDDMQFSHDNNDEAPVQSYYYSSSTYQRTEKSNRSSYYYSTTSSGKECSSSSSASKVQRQEDGLELIKPVPEVSPAVETIGFSARTKSVYVDSEDEDEKEKISTSNDKSRALSSGSSRASSSGSNLDTINEILTWRLKMMKKTKSNQILNSVSALSPENSCLATQAA